MHWVCQLTHITRNRKRRRSSSHGINDDKKEMVETSDKEDIEGDDEVNEMYFVTQSKKVTIIAF